MISTMTLDEILAEAIRRESAIIDFYRQGMHVTNPEARTVLAELVVQNHARILQLENLRFEIECLRELSIAMAD